MDTLGHECPRVAQKEEYFHKRRALLTAAAQNPAAAAYPLRPAVQVRGTAACLPAAVRAAKNPRPAFPETFAG
jgi:hypothetical protein